MEAGAGSAALCFSGRENQPRTTASREDGAGVSVEHDGVMKRQGRDAIDVEAAWRRWAPEKEDGEETKAGMAGNTVGRRKGDRPLPKRNNGHLLLDLDLGFRACFAQGQ